MKKLITLLIVLILNTPAFGEILVYKISGDIKGVDIEEQSSIRLKLRGYLTIDFDFDLNEITNSSLILQGTGADNEVLQETITDIIYEFKALGGTSKYEHLSIELYDEGYGLDAILTGKAKPIDIGSGSKEYFAPSLKGNLVCSDTMPILDHNTMGSGSLNLKLFSAKTKTANSRRMSLLQVVKDIQGELYTKGYDYY